jgi:hypothetical protein
VSDESTVAVYQALEQVDPAGSQLDQGHHPINQASDITRPSPDAL